MAETAPRQVLVVGAGLVGLLVSLMLARRGYAVLLAERAAAAPSPPDWSSSLAQLPIRHVALSPASRRLLQEAQAWPESLAAPFDAMHVWEERGTARLEFEHPDAGRLGWVVDHDGLQALLTQRAHAHPRIELCPHTEITAIDAARTVTLTAGATDTSRSLTPDLLLATDGAGSGVRKLLGVSAPATPTGHHALATLARMQKPHGGIARQRFLCAGPLALLPSPLPDVVSIVWSAPEAQVSRMRACAQAEFARALTHASEGVLGDVLDVGSRASFPIQQQLAARFAAAPGVLLLGDAARTLHPLAGQGVNLGFEDVARLLQLHAEGRLFEPQAQQRFGASRRVRSRAMQFAMATLQRTYAQRGPFANWVRNQGVNWLAGSAFAQRMLIEQALGLDAVTYNAPV